MRNLPSGANADLAAHSALIEELRDPAAYSHPVEAVQLVETHISSVLLAGTFAYKLKKPVDLGFVDFRTLARRRFFCAEELRLNRRTAPEIYLDVVPVTRPVPGAPARFGGSGETIDYAVRMRRFASDARLDQQAAAGRLDDTIIDGVASAIAALHADAGRAEPGGNAGTPDTIRHWASTNVSELVELTAGTDWERRIKQLADWTETEFTRRAVTFAERRALGYVRECHGDLHLGNIALIDGRPVLFDCLEFDAELRHIDVMSDVAFVWMDLIEHGHAGLAWRLLDRYLEITGDYGGLATLRFYGVYRALVRAKVALLRNRQARGTNSAADNEIEPYVVTAENLAHRRTLRLILTCGVAGSGKTTVSQQLLQRIGAVRVRSDIQRKRLAGVAAADHRHAGLGSALYDPHWSRLTYEDLERVAATIIDAGIPAIIDAAFLRRAEREPFVQLAHRLGARAAIVACEASAETLRKRVAARAARGSDASDATLEVLANQQAAFEAPAPSGQPLVLSLDTDTDPATLAARCTALAMQLGAQAVSPRGVGDARPYGRS
jgi:hypothetical protein